MNIVIQKKNLKSIKNIEKLNNAINKGDDVFIFINADWCGHCKAMKKDWSKLNKYKYGPNVVIANVNSELYEEITNFGPNVEGFPDLRYINMKKGINEKFENSGLTDTDRTFVAFNKWITSKTGIKAKTESNKHKTRKHVKGMVYGKSRSRNHKTRKNNKTKRRI